MRWLLLTLLACPVAVAVGLLAGRVLSGAADDPYAHWQRARDQRRGRR